MSKVSPSFSETNENRFEKFWTRIKKNSFISITIFFCSVVLIESALVCIFAYGVRNWKFSNESFERLFLSRVYFPDLGISKWEKTYGLHVNPGDVQEETQSIRSFRPDALLGWRPRENSKTLKFNSPIIVNSQGFVSIKEDGDFFHPFNKEKGVFRVIVLGGSTVYGIGSTPSGSLPAKIKTSLEKMRKDRVEVINAGVGGYTSGNELLYLISELHLYSPDLVIVYNGWNDVHFQNLRATELGSSWVPLRTRSHETNSSANDYFFEPKIVFGILAKIAVLTSRHYLHVLYEGLASIQLLRELIQGTGYIDVHTLEEWLTRYDRSEYNKVKYNRRIAVSYRNNLEFMAAAAKLYGFKIAFFLQPIMGPSKKPFTESEKGFFQTMSPLDLENRISFYKDATEIFKKLDKKFKKHDVACVENLKDVFQNTKEQAFSFTGHLKSSSNEIVANSIASSLQACGWTH